MVRNKLGLHLRASSKIVNMANRFESQIHMQRDGRKVNAKSIMSIATLAAPKGSQVELTALGPDAATAVDQISKLFADKFGEE
ncbi:MAG: HPr family phosphocarrier protein [Candidatus Alcyoniella australis]|nr:HPr family phosphocarrier protein [Candidatus Alcyoniella australis]